MNPTINDSPVLLVDDRTIIQPETPLTTVPPLAGGQQGASIKTLFRLLYCLVTIASVPHPIPSRTRP